MLRVDLQLMHGYFRVYVGHINMGQVKKSEFDRKKSINLCLSVAWIQS